MSFKKNSLPKFKHSIIEELYQYNFQIDPEILKKILTLPRKEIIADLELILKDLIKNSDKHEKRVYENDQESGFINSEYYSEDSQGYFMIHALNLLAELGAKESIDVILDFLAQDADFLELWLDDYLVQDIWMVLVKTFDKKNSKKYLDFIKDENNYLYAKSEFSEAIKQLALSNVNFKEKAIAIYKDLFTYFNNQVYSEKWTSQKANEDGDFALIGFLISDYLELKDTSLINLIEKLYQKEIVDLMIIGDFEEAKRIMQRPNQELREIQNIFQLYQEHVEEYSIDQDRERKILEDAEDGYEVEYLDEEFFAQFEKNDPETIHSEKIGRNELCPCGSGKKFKKCCLSKDELVQMRSQCSIHQAVVDKAMEFLALGQFEDDLIEAENNFKKYAKSAFDLEINLNSEEEDSFFNEWVINDYLFADEEYDQEILFWDIFLENAPKELTPKEIKVAQNFASSIRSIYEVENVQIGKGLAVRDVFTEERQFIKELRGSWGVNKWDYVYARVVLDENNQPFFSGNLFSLPRQEINRIKTSISEIKEVLESQLKRKVSLHQVLKIRGFTIYFIYKFMQKEFTNMIPNLQTSTGDEFAFCSAEWLVTDYQKILKLLQKEFEETSKKADPSKTFLWLNDESTILANFDLAQNKLKVETKSAKRLQNVKNILDKKASKFLKFEQEKIESVAEAMKNHTPSNDLKNEETQELEMDDDMKEMIFQKVQGNWASTPIPFLNDQTPLEAMKTKQGRDLLKELFKTYENTEGRIKKSGQDDFLNDTKRLKKMIGWKDN